MSIPKYEELYKEILVAVSDGKTHDMTAIRNSVAKQKNLTEEELTVFFESGTMPVFSGRVGWARTYLKMAGLIEFPARGLTRITAEGKNVLSSNPPRIDNNFLCKYETFLEFIARRDRKYRPSDSGNTDAIESIETPTERMQSAFSEINDSLADELLTEIMNQPPEFFEKLVVRLLVKMGYGGGNDGAGIVTPLSGDGGIDGIIREDRLGFSNIYIQTKRYNRDRTVGSPDIRNFIGAIAEYKNKKGLFVTTAKFTDGAITSAKASQIVLIDGERLAKLMIEYGVGVSTAQTLEIKKIDSDFFSE